MGSLTNFSKNKMHVSTNQNRGLVQQKNHFVDHTFGIKVLKIRLQRKKKEFIAMKLASRECTRYKTICKKSTHSHSIALLTPEIK